MFLLPNPALCDIYNITSPRKSSVGVEKAKRVRKKAHAQQVKNATPRVVTKNTKRLASEGNFSELPNKKRLVSCFGQGQNILMVEVAEQPR